MSELDEVITSYPKNRTNNWFAYCTIILIAAMVIDSYLIKPFIKEEILKDANIEYTNGSHGSGYYTYMFAAESGHHYLVSAQAYDAVRFGSVFYAEHSRIFHRPLGIIWKEDDGYFYQSKMGILTDAGLLTFVAFGIAIITCAHYFLRHLIPARGVVVRLYVGLAITLTLFLMYLIEPIV
jgi:hypothetical protein